MNPFPEANLPVNMKGPVQAEQPKRYGIMRARVGAHFPVRCKDGKIRVFQVRALDLLQRRVDEVRRDKAEKHQPHWLCFSASCRMRKWDSEEALLSDHPDLKVMTDQQEIHVIALWCEAPEITDKSALDEWARNEASQSALAARVKREDPIVGLLVP